MLKEVSDIMRQWKEESGLDKNDIIMISAYPTTTIEICTSKPGYLIGKGGGLLYKYRDKLKKIYPKLEYVKFIETDHWYIR